MNPLILFLIKNFFLDILENHFIAWLNVWNAINSVEKKKNAFLAIVRHR